MYTKRDAQYFAVVVVVVVSASSSSQRVVRVFFIFFIFTSPSNTAVKMKRNPSLLVFQDVFASLNAAFSLRYISHSRGTEDIQTRKNTRGKE
jgi:hypothetical protein